ncbi:MAG: sulfite exporter TauE/SafE family protein [Clostridia bacterium]|nr:sulfite exporter TauE/SafE family protein [Clostridia bacterium]
MEILWFVLIGVFGGVFGGMGMGGGTIIIPLLSIFLSISQKFAQGYNLYAFLIMAVVALIIHNKNKLVHFQDIILIVISGTLFCIGGSFLTTVVKTDILKIIFAGFLILLSIFEFVKIFKKS